MYSGEAVDRVRRDRVREMKREYEDGDDGEGCKGVLFFELG
jgi:hypothetical protein